MSELLVDIVCNGLRKNLVILCIFVFILIILILSVAVMALTALTSVLALSAVAPTVLSNVALLSVAASTALTPPTLHGICLAERRSIGISFLVAVNHIPDCSTCCCVVRLRRCKRPLGICPALHAVSRHDAICFPAGGVIMRASGNIESYSIFMQMFNTTEPPGGAESNLIIGKVPCVSCVERAWPKKWPSV